MFERHERARDSIAAGQISSVVALPDGRRVTFTGSAIDVAEAVNSVLGGSPQARGAATTRSA